MVGSAVDKGMEELGVVPTERRIYAGNDTGPNATFTLEVNRHSCYKSYKFLSYLLVSELSW